MKPGGGVGGVLKIMSVEGERTRGWTINSSTCRATSHPYQRSAAREISGRNNFVGGLFRYFRAFARAQAGRWQRCRQAFAKCNPRGAAFFR